MSYYFVVLLIKNKRGSCNYEILMITCCWRDFCCENLNTKTYIMKKLVVLVLIVIVFYVGCKKDESYVSSSSIIGEWSWISTCGGIAGICYTPKSTNQRINLVFTVDSMYKSIRNDTIKDSGRFHVYKVISADKKDTSNVLQYGSASQTFLIIRDSLYFPAGALCFDCFGSNYKRIR